MVIIVGKYTNSYKAQLGELATNGYTYRIADEQADDTCFSAAKTYRTVEEAQKALADIREFSSALSLAIKDITGIK